MIWEFMKLTGIPTQQILLPYGKNGFVIESVPFFLLSGFKDIF